MSDDTYHVALAVFGSHSGRKSDRPSRTSITHPLEIATVHAGPRYGKIGVTFCPGKIQPDGATGGWNRDLRVDIESIAKFGAVALVSLIENHEIEALQVGGIQAECRRVGIDWLHLPIVDVSTPSEAFEAAWVTVGEGLRSRLRNGFNIVFHCKGGLGRAGTIAARLLVELGVDPDDAIHMVRGVRPGAIETDAQEEHVYRQRPIPEPRNETTVVVTRERARASMLGLFCGDAAGTTVEFQPRGSFGPVTDIVGGGPFRLKPGEWTDDGAMALALSESLLACNDLDERDLLQRFCRWWREGENSVTGYCFDIGNVTSTALSRFEETGDIYSGPTDERTAGNGSLMRLAPVAIRFWNNPTKLRDAARRQSYTTHGAQEAVDACEAFAMMLADAIQGKPLTDVLSASYGPFTSKVQGIVDGSWRGKHREDIRSSGYVIDTLEAALWSVASSGSFEEAVLRAVNLGDDADSVGAVAGQIAGALYGLTGVPERWRKTLAWGDRIEGLADRLFTESQR